MLFQAVVPRGVSSNADDNLYLRWTEIPIPGVLASSVEVSIIGLYDDNNTLNDLGFWEVQMFTGISKKKTSV